MVIACAAGFLAACGGSKNEDAKADAALRARVNARMAAEEASRRQEEAQSSAAARISAAAREMDIRRESEATFRAHTTVAGEAAPQNETLTIDKALARVRGLAKDPNTFDARNARFNAAHTAVCAEVSMGGATFSYRNAYVTRDETHVDPGTDTVAHRVFEQNLKRLGCNEL